MEEIKNENGGVFFRTRQSFENGGSVVVVAAFNDTENILDLQVFNVANIANPLKKEAIHQLINNLNTDYRFSKFYEYEGKVTVQYSYAINAENFEPSEAINNLIMLVETSEESYPKFMKIQWA
ncbi:YbjN domain-containing protein [Planococcus maritimus]|nr:YbjN domain-containing protein [Planococcus maritimus]